MQTTTMQSQMPLSDLTTLEPFVERFAQEVATQEGALQEGATPEVQAALMRVRQTWAERNAHWLFLGAGAVGAIAVLRVIRGGRS